MFEKVNPSHPDKVADRIAGAIVDLAYAKERNPKCAVEVLLGHGSCNVIIESSVVFTEREIAVIVERIAGKQELRLVAVKQDPILASNQEEEVRCGDNGIFKGVCTTIEEKALTDIAKTIYWKYPCDGKYIIDRHEKLIICQSNATSDDIEDLFPGARVNPLGYWEGGTNVDSGCTNRKLGSDMAQSVTGGGLHGKDLSKADVSVNIVCFKRAQKIQGTVEALCAIGDDIITLHCTAGDGQKFDESIAYEKIVEEARKYINDLGGFEEFAKWGLVR